MNRPVHFEILSEDPEKAAAFYEGVFGWKVARWDGPQTYWMVTTGEAGTAGIDGGIMQRHMDQAVVNTMEVPSLEEAIGRVVEGGGEQVRGPNVIPGVGTHAYCTDPTGVLFGLLEPARDDG